MKPIEIRGGYENNLKGINLTVEKEKIVAFTGVSGSGKTSVVFGIIAVESQRQLNETFPLFIRHKMPMYERPQAESIENITPAIVVDQKRVVGGSRSTVGTLIDIAPLLRLLFSRLATPSAGVATAYSFNSPRGMCPDCKGIGEQVKLDLDLLLDKTKSLNGGAIKFKPWAFGGWQWRLYGHSGFFDVDKPLAEYDSTEWFNLLHGSGRKVIIENDPTGVWYEGMVDRFNRLYLNRDISSLSQSVKKSVQSVVRTSVCSTCKGKRLNSAALASQLFGHNISSVADLEVADLLPLLAGIEDPVGQAIAKEMSMSLQRMIDMGLGYLSLNRSTHALSGGEAQRLKLIKHLGSSLTGVTYILDEPSTGLHPVDIDRIIHILYQLRDKGNTVLVVEHDAKVIRSADRIVDVGPAAGRYGGEIVFTGTPEALESATTLTALALKKPLVLGTSPREITDWLHIQDATQNNLANVTVDIPARALTVVTGVSGSGKSSLILGDFLQQYPEAKVLDQKPPGTSSRSNLATWLGIMGLIRDAFAKSSGEKAALFSFNSAGKCPECEGRGEIVADMVYADPVVMVCEECHGLRYCRDALSHTIKGLNIADVLKLTVGEASGFFGNKAIDSALQVLKDVGLDYITLGQPTSTLSGGEAQRMKLAECLQARGNIYVLDEPTSGLHMADVASLLALLQSIVDRGNTLVVIEHDQQVICASDWIIDMGPGGGRFGGHAIYQGRPSGLLLNQDSLTAGALRPALEGAKR